MWLKRSVLLLAFVGVVAALVGASGGSASDDATALHG